MKRLTYLTAILLSVAVVTITSCDSKRQPGKIYMPDMAYSRAIETYTLLNDTVFTDDHAKQGREIFYNRKPVNGTIGVGELAAYTLPDDSVGYAMSAQVKNPLAALTGKDISEAERLYNINCAICHGADGKANGPLATSGKIGGVANLTADAYVKMADGTMFHSIFYGKNNMGSYASQLSRKQRWMMVQYIRTLQPKVESAPTTSTAAVVVKTDSTAKKGK
jgi:mono/diheme cytochrome c family protein